MIIDKSDKSDNNQMIADTKCWFPLRIEAIHKKIFVKSRELSLLSQKTRN